MCSPIGQSRKAQSRKNANEHGANFRRGTQINNSPLKTPIGAVLPISLVRDTAAFMRLMLQYEKLIEARDRRAVALLIDALPADDRTPSIRERIEALTDDLIKLERNGWNGIWARILSNFLTTACLGRFSMVIGNPPWIDWKNLPAGYRERIKAMCIDRGLFSGAGRTGGINLNICALIAHVSMSNWLDKSGRLAFLMPRELANQASYEGWRTLADKWHFIAFHDWSNAGHPFDPVKEHFMTFVIGNGRTGNTYVPVFVFRKKRGDRTSAAHWKDAAEAARHLEVLERTAGQIIPKSTAFAFASSEAELNEFARVAGRCSYIGREGVQFYPQELQLFRYVGAGPRDGTAWLTNVQVEKARYKLPHGRILLETEYLLPLVTARAIKPFRHMYDGLLVPFPYQVSNPTKPVEPSVLKRRSPLLFEYYKKHRDIIEKLSPFNATIRGPEPGAFYGLARTGPYSFANVYVAFRKDTEWCATVVSSEKVPWNGQKRLAFQSHAVSICERQNRELINEDEAHYICAIFNTSIVSRFITASSDDRSYKVRPPIFVPLYDSTDGTHQALAELSKAAHRNPEQAHELAAKAERTYLSLCKQDNREPGPASKPLSLYPMTPEDALRRAMRAPAIDNETLITRRLEAAEADVEAGRVLGPFDSAEDLMRAVERRTRARRHD